MTEKEKKGIQLQLPIEWDIPEEIKTRYSTHIVVQREGHEFIISFFETYLPIILGSPEELKQQIEKLESVRAKCVARVIIGAHRLPGFIKALQENFEAYSEQQTKKEAE